MPVLHNKNAVSAPAPTQVFHLPVMLISPYSDLIAGVRGLESHSCSQYLDTLPARFSLGPLGRLGPVESRQSLLCRLASLIRAASHAQGFLILGLCLLALTLVIVNTRKVDVGPSEH